MQLAYAGPMPRHLLEGSAGESGGVIGATRPRFGLTARHYQTLPEHKSRTQRILEMLACLTIGFEVELQVSKSGRAFNIPNDWGHWVSPESDLAGERDPDELDRRLLTQVPKAGKIKSIAYGVRAFAAEAGAAIREVIIGFRLANGDNIDSMVASAFRDPARELGKYGLWPVFASLALFPHKEHGIIQTALARFMEWMDRHGIANGLQTAGFQPNIGTTNDPDLRAELTGIMGDFSHVFLAISATSPYGLDDYDLEDSSTYPHPRDLGWASTRTRTWMKMLTASFPQRARNAKESQDARLARLRAANERYKERQRQESSNGHVEDWFDPTDPKVASRDHVGVRETAFGVEPRVADLPHTQSEMKLQAILAAGTAAHILHELFLHEKGSRGPVEQTSNDVREQAHLHAARHGMTAQLLDPMTGEMCNAWEVLTNLVETIEPALNYLDRESEIKQYDEAKRILKRLKEIGPPSERMRAARLWYRDRHDLPTPATAELSESEMAFMQCFVAVEQKYDIFAGRDFVLEEAERWHEKALQDGLFATDVRMDESPERPPAPGNLSR